MSRLLLLLLLSLAGCPEPASELPAIAPAVGTPAAPAELPPSPEVAAVARPAESPPPVGDPAVDLAAKTLLALAPGSPTITIRGRVEGAAVARVDFTALRQTDGNTIGEILQIVNVTDGTFEVQAPATYDRPIYVTAVSDVGNDGIRPDDPGGILESPLTLAGKDHDVVLALSTDGTWMKNVPWFVTPPTEGPPSAPAQPTTAPAASK